VALLCALDDIFSRIVVVEGKKKKKNREEAQQEKETRYFGSLISVYSAMN
jgi:hypothetical protein